MDTYIIINRTFDDLLMNDCFLGFSCDVALCTAVIGAKKGSSFIKGIIDMYDSNKFIDRDYVCNKSKGANQYSQGQWVPNNGIILGI